MRYIN